MVAKFNNIQGTLVMITRIRIDTLWKLIVGGDIVIFLLSGFPRKREWCFTRMASSAASFESKSTNAYVLCKAMSKTTTPCQLIY